MCLNIYRFDLIHMYLLYKPVCCHIVSGMLRLHITMLQKNNRLQRPVTPNIQDIE
jgi:hypothetical protein